MPVDTPSCACRNGIQLCLELFGAEKKSGSVAKVLVWIGTESGTRVASLARRARRLFGLRRVRLEARGAVLPLHQPMFLLIPGETVRVIPITSTDYNHRIDSEEFNISESDNEDTIEPTTQCQMNEDHRNHYIQKKAVMGDVVSVATSVRQPAAIDECDGTILDEMKRRALATLEACAVTALQESNYETHPDDLPPTSDEIPSINSHNQDLEQKTTRKRRRVRRRPRLTPLSPVNFETWTQDQPSVTDSSETLVKRNGGPERIIPRIVHAEP